MRHSVRLRTIVRRRGKEESKEIVFEVENFINLESELKRRTTLQSEGGKVVSQTIVITSMRTSY